MKRKAITVLVQAVWKKKIGLKKKSGVSFNFKII
jgi:hypothetical protein